MPSVCLYFQVHQPLRIKRFRVFDVGWDPEYFNDRSDTNLNNKKVLGKVAGKSYLPTNNLFLNLLKKYPELKLSFSFSGILLEQLEKDFPQVLDSFKKLVDTDRVEILSETYHHSLAFFYSKSEFEKQVDLHRAKVKEIFGVKPRVFRNTELAYNNELATWADSKGYQAILAEGWDSFLGWRSPNFVYRPKNTNKIKILLKNYKLSDDIAFRFSDKSWRSWPLTADKFAHWVSAINGNGHVVNLFMDYETFGEHQWEAHGIFNFLSSLPREILKHPDNDFATVSEVVQKYPAMDEVDVPSIVTWADTERDLSAWVGNAIQTSAISFLYSLEDRILKVGDAKLIDKWRKLQTSDHFYYMCTKWFSDGDVHKYFNPYESPYDAFISFMNAANDLKLRLEKKSKGRIRKFDLRYA
ncbi:alpha-amylase [Candidatus Woesebacteria bacterium RIFCSPHIGHO2_01_FULL_39_32]|uniref:Alpha-amylase n=2 Tax=Candidatus Woeseibacteriota TaxID=1752722 RepID=A0A0G0SWC3_9BACT|nr:MAG: alpha-amylase [Candidatus Woesebacteria bacterium GW2011_GWA1_39_8]OGM04838.1 MAG: alpha-amylase [Candidatus Woesebacteria bacterium GWB1_37_5]OGM25244.1 MAG: alpha-amylase [Candidatus Woesebacteria bacterium RIFCSPHIGHO2_01_FULL_39_32]OGM37744.1 MAG: alpha-amylase [Candidatus Woesebacteria bacterium RIFCSPHIGHO2_12_FULL_38_11]OGM64775.1 MAG: alpha-amylase [Candidatus Woesebacteria bacterium RIFCSPLOWO2_01_FULL_39_25]